MLKRTDTSVRGLTRAMHRSGLICGLGLCTTLATLGTGCNPNAHEGMLANLNNIARLEAATKRSDGNTDAPVLMEMPRMKARFCLQRAINNYKAGNANTTVDLLMVIVAGSAAGVGTSFGAATSAMDEGDTRHGLEIASVTTLAAAGALLGLRTALNLSEVGRAQKIAAARNVNAAITILEKYALTDDPKLVGTDGFDTCRDEEENVANAFPGVSSSEALEQVIAKFKKEQKEATEEAAKKATDAQQVEQKTAKGVSEKEQEIRKLEEQRVALEKEIADAKKQDRPAVQDIEKKEKKLEEVKQNLDGAKEDQKSLIKEARDAQIDAAEAAVTAAEATFNAKKAAVLLAGGQLRRAVFYLTSRDVELAQRALDDAANEVRDSREALKVAQKRLDDLVNKPNDGAAKKAAAPGSASPPTTP